MKAKPAGRKKEAGYSLVAIMAVVMFSLILTTAAAPSLRFESQREKEEEMLWRGQQIAMALARSRIVRGSFPTDLKDLVKGIDLGTKKMRFLRLSALCDPMTPCTPGESNWRSVSPGDPLVKELLDAYIATREKGQLLLPHPPATLVQFAAIGAAKLPRGPLPDAPLDDATSQPSAETDQKTAGGKPGAPIIGVVSRKSGKMFRNYFGIDQYDKALFFPGVTVIVSGFNNPMILGALTSPASGQDANCPNGGIYIDGKCWGKLTDGRCPPGQENRKNKCVSVQ